ncbi:MAG: hypothetical protein K2P98_04045 [Neisseriaceae bacterium]|nr:hypothetical protein [Neisseriaceae bacterium]
MNMNISKNTQQWIKAGLLSLLVCAPNFAFAAAGLEKVENELVAYQTAIMSIYAILAVFYLIFKAFQIKANKADWQDFIMALLWVAIAGAIPIIAKTAWNTFRYCSHELKSRVKK